MPIEFQQTDTDAPFGAIAACSGLSAGTTVDAGLCEFGGTPGSTELVADHPGSGSGTLRLIHFELDVPAGTGWDAGDWTVSMGVTTQSSQLIWDSVFICRVDSGGTSQETLASATGLGIKFNLANVSHTLAGSAQTPNAGDRVYIVVGCTNGQTMSNTVGITPSDIITAPFSSGVTTVEGTAAGDYTHSGTAAGAASPSTAEGTAAGSYSHTGTAAGQATVVGSAAGDYSYSGTAAGTESTPPIEGTATGAYVYTGVVDPDRVRNLTATPVSPSQINLEWDTYAGASAYLIERDDVVVDQVADTETTYQDTGLDADTQYQYRVGAVV